MIRQLAECPYCQGCEVALGDSFDVVVNPDADPSRPCPHLVYVEGRYSQWGLSPLPGRKTKIARMVGSNEFEWQHPGLVGRDDVGPLLAFLKDLVGGGDARAFAPAVEHVVRAIVRDEKITEANGKEYPSWEIEGAAVFARDAEAFLASLPECLERQSAPWTDLPGSGSG